jgi:hypothetical protein
MGGTEGKASEKEKERGDREEIKYKKIKEKQHSFRERHGVGVL